MTTMLVPRPSLLSEQVGRAIETFDLDGSNWQRYCHEFDNVVLEAAQTVVGEASKHERRALERVGLQSAFQFYQVSFMVSMRLGHCDSAISGLIVAMYRCLAL
jgi:hypothetical protein